LSALTEASKDYVLVRERLQKAEAAVTALKAEKEAVTRALLSAMASEGLDSFKSAALGKHLIATEKKFPRLADKTRELEMLAWLEALGHGGVIRRQVNPSTLGATLREIVESGADLPDFIEIHKENDVTMRGL
jgi:hypothetical protein